MILNIVSISLSKRDQIYVILHTLSGNLEIMFAFEKESSDPYCNAAACQKMKYDNDNNNNNSSLIVFNTIAISSIITESG